MKRAYARLRFSLALKRIFSFFEFTSDDVLMRSI